VTQRDKDRGCVRERVKERWWEGEVQREREVARRESERQKPRVGNEGGRVIKGIW